MLFWPSFSASADERKFALRIALINACGYAAAAAIATYIDARIPSHERFGRRMYQYGYYLTLFAVPIVWFTYMGILRARTRAAKCIASAISLVLGVIVSIPVFLPELPHNGFTGAVTMYALAAVIACWIRYTDVGIPFVDDVTLPVVVRIEAIKSVMSMWQGLALATVGGFVAFLAPWVSAGLRNNETIVRTRSDLFLLNSFSFIQAALISIGYILGPIREVFAHLIAVPELFRHIRGSPPSE